MDAVLQSLDILFRDTYFSQRGDNVSHLGIDLRFGLGHRACPGLNADRDSGDIWLETNLAYSAYIIYSSLARNPLDRIPRDLPPQVGLVRHVGQGDIVAPCPLKPIRAKRDPLPAIRCLVYLA